jgi:hypothetical protein
MGWYQLTLAGYASSRSSVACSVVPSAPDHEVQARVRAARGEFTRGRENRDVPELVHESMKPFSMANRLLHQLPVAGLCHRQDRSLRDHATAQTAHVHDETCITPAGSCGAKPRPGLGLERR